MARLEIRFSVRRKNRSRIFGAEALRIDFGSLIQ